MFGYLEYFAHGKAFIDLTIRTRAQDGPLTYQENIKLQALKYVACTSDTPYPNTTSRQLHNSNNATRPGLTPTHLNRARHKRHPCSTESELSIITVDIFSCLLAFHMQFHPDHQRAPPLAPKYHLIPSPSHHPLPRLLSTAYRAMQDPLNAEDQVNLQISRLHSRPTRRLIHSRILRHCSIHLQCHLVTFSPRARPP